MVRQVLTIWNRIRPMASKQRGRIRILIPSGPIPSGTLHGKHLLPQLRQCHSGDPKTARSNPRQAARDVGRHPETGKVSRDTRADRHKVCVQFVRCVSGRVAGLLRLSAINGRTVRYRELLRCVRSLSSMFARLSRRIADLTLMSSSRKAGDLPSRCSIPLRSVIRARVAGVTAGAPGLRTTMVLSGARLSSAGSRQ